MINFLTQKAWHAVIAGFLGIVIGSTGTMSALSSMSVARAQETVPVPVMTEPIPQPQPYQQPGTEMQPYRQPEQYPSPLPDQYPKNGEMPKDGMMPPAPMEGFSGRNGSGSDGGQGSMPGFGNQGPSEEDRQRQEEEMDKRRKEMEKRGLEQMKRGIRQASSGVKRMKREFDRYIKKGMKVSAECTETLQKIETIIQTVHAAEDFEAVQESGMEDMPELFESLNDCRQQLEMQSRVPQMLKRIDRELKNIERQWTRSKKNPPADMADVVAEGDAAISSIKQAREKVQSLANEGNFEEIESLLEEEVFGRFDDVGAAIRRLEAARNAKRFAAQFNTRIRAAERLVKQLKNQKKDTAELEQILAEAKEKAAELKTLKAGSEEWEAVVEELAEIEQNFAESAETGEDIGAYFAPKPGQMGPELSVPKEFGF